MTKNAEWLAEQVAKYQDDPEFITYGILDDVTDVLCGEMEAQGMSRADLARKMGVSRAYVTRFLNTPLNTRVETIVRFAQAVGLDVKVELVQKSASGVTQWTSPTDPVDWSPVKWSQPLHLVGETETDQSRAADRAA